MCNDCEYKWLGLQPPSLLSLLLSLKHFRLGPVLPIIVRVYLPFPYIRSAQSFKILNLLRTLRTTILQRLCVCITSLKAWNAAGNEHECTRAEDVLTDSRRKIHHLLYSLLHLTPVPSLISCPLFPQAGSNRRRPGRHTTTPHLKQDAK